MFTVTFGKFVSTLRFQDIPLETVAAIKLRVLDLLGAASAGYKLGTVDPLLDVYASHGTATVWGSGEHRTLRDAVLLNTFMAHACYLEDGSRFTGGHPSSAVVPAVLTLAEHLGSCGKDIIAAVTAGYEVFLRIGRAIYPAVAERHFQSTAVLAGVSAAAGCSSLLKLAPSAAANAIALGSMLGVGLRGMNAVPMHPIQVARSAEAGLVAALLAERGESGPLNVIDTTFLRAFGDNIGGNEIDADLGASFCIGETYLKRHGGCRGNHAPVDMIQMLAAENGFSADLVESIEIMVDTVTFTHHRSLPLNPADSQASIDFAVAVSLVYGDASIFRYNDEYIQDPKIRSLMSRVRVLANASLDRDFPDKRGAVATVVLRDGRCFTGNVSNAKGEPENPISPEEVQLKFRTLTRSTFGISQSEAIVRCVDNFECLDQVSDLVDLMTVR